MLLSITNWDLRPPNFVLVFHRILDFENTGLDIYPGPFLFKAGNKI
jgi:hypothetical protein